MTEKERAIKEAAQRWVGEFNTIPTSMIERLMVSNEDEWREVSKPAPYDKVWVCEREMMGEIKQAFNKETYEVQLEDGRLIMVGEKYMALERQSMLPMWGTMWSFGDNLDDYWLDEMDGIWHMSQCRFRIYEHEEWGYFFGIDGAGYDFYESHWIPLYKARGLHWHEN